MKKSKKLLSILLAMLMILSTMSVAAYAYGDYKNPNANLYDSNDNPITAFFTDEERASVAMDTIDDLLNMAWIAHETVDLSILGSVDIFLTSYDGFVHTLSQGLVGTAQGMSLVGDLNKLNRKPLDGAPTRAAGGDVLALKNLLTFLGNNKDIFYNVINKGNLSLGTVGGGIDLSAVNDLLADLPSLLGEQIYLLNTRWIDIGDDPAFPNDYAWSDLANKPTLDGIVANILKRFLTQPTSLTKITDPSQNTLGAQAIPEVSEDGNTYYYCYGKNDDGTLKLTGSEKDKTYLMHWDPASALLQGDIAEFIDGCIDGIGTTSLYGWIEKVLPWAYDQFGAPNLDGQFRATLMQFCGAYNAPEKDEAIQAQLKAKMTEYKDIYKAGGPEALKNAFAAKVGDAGNNNFMYLSLDGAPISKDSKNLYYVVEWEGGYEYYKVDMSGINPFFEMANWEYQMGTWAEIAPNWTEGTSILQYVNDIVGNIVKEAVPSVNWKAGNANIADNLANLIKMFIKQAPQWILGKDFEVPADFDSYTLEQVAVMIAKVLMPQLMPSLVIPDSVSSLEEIIVYGVREFTVEILPEYGRKWDAQIAAAATEDDFLNIALNMGMSIGNYYLKNVIGLGSVYGGVEAVPMGPDFGWEEMLNYDLDWIIKTWLPGLSSYVKEQFPAAFAGNDPFAKLSAVFSAIAPTVAATFGMGDADYAINARTLFNNVRAVLNGDVNPLLNAIMRKDAGAGNLTLYQVVVKLVTEMFGGLGLRKSGSWANLNNLLNNAANSATPLQSVIGPWGNNNTIAQLARDLIGCLADTQTIWVQDMLKLITSFTTITDTLKFDHTSVWLDSNAYMGVTEADIPVYASMTTYGVPEAYNNGVYRSGTTTLDPGYKMQVKSIQVKDENGNVKASEGEKAVLLSGQTGTYTVKATGFPSGLGRWTVETKYIVITPTGDTLDFTDVKAILVSSAKNDGMVDTSHKFTDELSSTRGSGSRAWTIKTLVNVDYATRNIYISENGLLSDVTKALFTLTDQSTETRNNTNPWWRHNRVSSWTNSMTATLNGAAVDVNSLWFGPALNGGPVDSTGAVSVIEDYTTTGTTRGPVYATVSAPLWKLTGTEDNAVQRSDFPGDFYDYKLNVQGDLHINYAGVTANILGTPNGTEELYVNRGYNLPVSIILYNSYGLESLLNSELSVNRARADYSADADAAWTEYQAQLSNAIDQMYLNWSADTFVANHTQDGVSTFKLAYEGLAAAVEALEEFKLEEETEETEVAKLAPSDPASPLHFAWLAVEAQKDMKLSNQDYIMYRWLKYYYTYAGILGYLDAATPPSGEAYAKLDGVPGEKVNAAIAAMAEEDLKALAELMKVDPTAEEIAAAKKAYDDFEMPVYDMATVANDVSNMKANYNRMFAKYPDVNSDVRYYGNNAVALYGQETADAYTAESYARYTDALATLKAVLTDAGAKASTLHYARYEFLVAYKALVKSAEAADYAAIEANVNKANAILANMADYKATAASGLTDTEAFTELLAALGYEVTVDGEKYIIGGDYTGVSAMNQKGMLKANASQYWVDGVNDNLAAALANIEPLATAQPSLDLSSLGEETGVVIDNTSYCANADGFIYGINTDMGEMIEDYLTTPAGSIRVTENANGVFSTGATIELLNDNGDVVATYIFVFFGDVNGDGLVEAADVTIIEGIAGYMDFDYMAGDGTAESMAMDINGDGLIEAADVTYYEGVAGYMDFPTQAETAAAVAAGLGIA